ncbi:MAG: 50S ribosomal protein L25/general stress protein Ctc, partial [Alphaproteobacteria bacterium]|nr:50S ribosomal protein L25/general stress protein Ctc [Alphaproteobacteria bacterium]
MAESITLSAKPREGAGRGPARAVRRAGRVPGILYAEGKPPVMISVDPQQLGRELVKPGFFARLLDVELDGAKVRALPREVQLDPVTDRPVHVDLLRVTAGTRIRVNVPVRFLNPEASPGIRRGGILNVVRHEIEMFCPAENIPGQITVDLEGL